MSRFADGATLLFVGLLFLSVPGMLYNNLNNSGMINTSTAMTCDNNLGSCVLSTNVACQANAANCQLSGSAISFFNSNSPFTQVLQGNIFGLWNQLTTNGQATGHGPYDSVGNSQYLTANCIVDDGASAGHDIDLVKWQVINCQQANSDGSNMTKAQASTWNNWNTNLNGTTKALSFYKFAVSNATGYTMDCAENLQVNYTASGNPYAGYTWYGCDVFTQSITHGCSTLFPPTLACLKENYYNSFLIAVPWAYGNLLHANGYACAPGTCWHVNVPVQLEAWETGYCYATQASSTRDTNGFLITPQCDQWFSNIKQQATNTGANFGIITPLITFVVGLVLLFIGLGIGFSAQGSVLGTGTGFSLSSNPQGTKLAQVMGLGLILWSFFYSQFSVWFTSGILPAGLDGQIGIIALVIDGLIFGGLYLLIVQGQTPQQ